MIDTDKYEGHLIDKAVEEKSQVWAWNEWMLKNSKTVDVKNITATIELLNDAPKLLAVVKRLQYLEKYAPTFQVFAQNEEDMEEEYTQHGSLKECEEYIATLKDGWVGRIEVIEYYVPTNNPQIKTIEEWRNEE
tara:strand:- start:1740 stop:2141 length:402 start_codon:yes stop_codon:yes gene_type:complete